MAHKIKDLEIYFTQLRKVYEDIIADDPQPGLLDELDGDRRILAHAAFYIVSKSIAKKLDGMGPFRMLRLVEEQLLRSFITDPNSERVDRLLDKADLVYELLPYCVADSIDDCATGKETTFAEEPLYDTYGLLFAAREYAVGIGDDMLDTVLDSLSLRIGRVGSPIIEAEAAEIMEYAKGIDYSDIDDADDVVGKENEAPTIAQLRRLDVDRRMLVLGLLSVNMDAIVDGMDCPETRSLREDITKAISAFDGGAAPEEIEDSIDRTIESIKDVISFIMGNDRRDDSVTKLLCTMFISMLTVSIRDAHDLSDKEFAKVWSKVHPDGRFADDALITYSRKINERDLPNLIRDYDSNIE